MKKIISCYIALCIIALAIIPISANNTNTISKSEAQELVGKANLFHIGTHVEDFRPGANHIVETTKEKVYVYDEETKEVILKEGGVEFLRVIEENLPGGSFEAMCRYAGTLYTEDIASSSYMFLAGYDSYKMYCESRGYLYFQDIYGDWFMFSHLDHSAAFLNTEFYKNKDYTKIDIDIISGDSQSAIAKIDVKDAWSWSDTVTCKFVKTQEGWRIAESEYSILLAIGHVGMEEYRASVSPSTGDTAGERVALLGAVSLACIIPAACLTLKRRRRVAVD